MTDPQVIVNLGTGGSDLNGQNGSTSSADSNDARFLDWPGDNAGNYVYLSGVAGNYLSIPHDSSMDTPTDFVVTVHMALDDVASGSQQEIVSKYVTSGNKRQWRLALNTIGNPTFYWSTDGSSIITKGCDAVIPYDDGQPFWLRVSLDASNASSVYELRFFTSLDGVTFTQLGSTITGGAATSIYLTDAPVYLGQLLSSTFPSAMKIYSCVFGNLSTEQFSLDTSVITSGSATSFTAVTGQTVTINRSTSGRKSVAVVSPVWLFGTDDRMEIPTDVRLNMPAGEDRTYLMMFRVWDNALANARFFGKKTSGSPPSFELRNTSGGDLAMFLQDGTSNISALHTDPVSGALEMRGFIRNTTTLKADEVVDGVVSQSNNDALGAIEPTSTLALMADPGGGFNNAAELFAFMVFDRVLTDAEMTAIMDYYTSKVA